MTDQCSTCFFVRTDADGLKHCHFYPPAPAGSAAGAVWPAVADTDWCGSGAAASGGVSFQNAVNGLPFGPAGH